MLNVNPKNIKIKQITNYTLVGHYKRAPLLECHHTHKTEAHRTGQKIIGQTRWPTETHPTVSANSSEPFFSVTFNKSNLNTFLIKADWPEHSCF